MPLAEYDRRYAVVPLLERDGVEEDGAGVHAVGRAGHDSVRFDVHFVFRAGERGEDQGIGGDGEKEEKGEGENTRSMGKKVANDGQRPGLDAPFVHQRGRCEL